jgi:antitoxin CptB
MSNAGSLSDDERALVARLRWRCRRGMLELDVLLTAYLDHRYAEAPPAERRAFAALLDLQDPQLLAFVMGSDAPADPDLSHVVARLTATEPQRR